MKKECNSVRPMGQPTNSSENELAEVLDAWMEEANKHGNELFSEVNTPSPLDATKLCPDPGDWLGLACGEARPAEVDALLAHAATCSDCAARLRVSLRLLSEDASEAENSELEQLASGSAAWLHRMSVELAHTPHKADHARRIRVYLWAGAAMAASLALAVGLSLWRQHANTPERLLAETYTHTRLFELRMPGAGFAEVTPGTHLRGGSSGHESSTLLDARSRIERQLEQDPNDPHWLQLEARADLLGEKFDPAIDILDRLLAAGPVTPSLLVDDASAYFQRGSSSGSENDRATALDYLRRADELAPGDTVVLFNEAVAMEDRGQVMNAVETWNRYLRFEHDPHWLAEGQRRLQSLELKLNQLKTHQSRMERHLATPGAMRALAADAPLLATLDEEFSSTLLPKLLGSAYPQPVDRSRGSPCAEPCKASRELLRALASSLEQNHKDNWLTQFLPSASSPPNQDFLRASQSLGRAIDASLAGDSLAAQKWALSSRDLFHRIGNAAGEDRAEVERIYALQRSSEFAPCYQAARALLSRNPDFAWMQIHGLTEQSICDTGPGAATRENPSSLHAESLAREHHYLLLDMRARNILGGAAVESGDSEDAWRIFLATERIFYMGDFPSFRAYTILGGLAEVEKSTPRVRLSLLLQREALGLLELTQGSKLIPSQRFDLAIAAIRAGFIPEAQEELRKVKSELAESDGDKSTKGFLADSEIAMANLYLGHGDKRGAAAMLDAAHEHMADVDSSFDQRDYAAARGELDLALGRPEEAEPMVRGAILDEERKARKVGAGNILFARQDRDLYAVLAGIWLAQGRTGDQILALWERYRLRILGEPVSLCANRSLACLEPRLLTAMARMGEDRAIGQVVLLDRLLRYQVSAKGALWNSVSIGREDLLNAAAPLERATSSPATSQASVDQAALRLGGLLLGGIQESSLKNGQLLLEPDPLLGNLPWPAVETASGPIGLRFNLEETPSLLLAPRADMSVSKEGNLLVVGASLVTGESDPLPEVLNEARAVARFGQHASLLVSDQATQAQVVSRLGSARVIHFAGHTAQQDGVTRFLLAPTLPRSSQSGAGESYLDIAVLRKYPPRAAQLAVFSTCSSDKREEGWNHGMEDIVDMLATLKVPEVVATRWQIDSASAVPMMDAFYGGLARGLTVPKALVAARQSLVGDFRYRHPYYWAGYYASGSGRSDLRQVFQAN